VIRKLRAKGQTHATAKAFRQHLLPLRPRASTLRKLGNKKLRVIGGAQPIAQLRDAPGKLGEQRQADGVEPQLRIVHQL
jgi:hypothetical protein